MLEDAEERLTQRQILEQWPDDFRKPDLATISRGLKRGVEQGLILQQGSGRKNDPYRYWLPGKEDEFPPGPNASPEALKRFRRRHQEKFFEAIGIDPKAVRAAAAAGPPDEGNLPAPAAPSTASMVANPQPEPVQGASLSEPVPAPAPAPTPQPAPRRRSRRKPVAKAPAAVVPAQEAMPVASTAPFAQPSAPVPRPPAVPAALPRPLATEEAAAVPPPEPTPSVTRPQPASPLAPPQPPVASPPPAPPAAPKEPTPEELVAAERRRIRRWPYG